MFLEETVESGYLAKMTQKGSIPRRNGPKPLYLAHIPLNRPNTCCFRPVLAIFLEETVKTAVLAKMTQNSYFLEESVKTAVLAKMTQNGSNSGNMAKTGQNRAKTGLLPGYGPNTCCFRPVLAIFLEEWVKSGVFGQNSSNTGYTRNPGYLAIFLEEWVIWPISRDIGQIPGIWPISRDMGQIHAVLGLF